MNLGESIKAFRKKQKIRQNALAKMAGISQTYMSQIEANKKEPNLSTVKQITIALKVPLPILMFLSLDINDIEPKKRKAFTIINPIVRAMLMEFF